MTASGSFCVAVCAVSSGGCGRVCKLPAEPVAEPRELISICPRPVLPRSSFRWLQRSCINQPTRSTAKCERSVLRSTSIPVERARQQQHHGQQSASQVQSAQHQQTVPDQPQPEPQGFRPYNGRQTGSDAPQPAYRPATEAAAAHMMSIAALSSFAMNAADTFQAVSPAGGAPMQHNTAGADTVMAHSTARNSNILAMPWVQSLGAQAPQSGQGLGPMQQLQSLPGTSPEQTAFQALQGSFLKQVHMAPTPPRSPVHAPEPEQQVCICSLNYLIVRFVLIITGQESLYMESRLPTGILPKQILLWEI